jgi:hypothetical protein
MADTAPQAQSPGTQPLPPNRIAQLYAQAQAARLNGDHAEAQRLSQLAQLRGELHTSAALRRVEDRRFRQALAQAQLKARAQEQEATARIKAGEDFNAQLRKTWRAGNTVPGDPIWPVTCPPCK